jgi:hypothetical protein
LNEVVNQEKVLFDDITEFALTRVPSGIFTFPTITQPAPSTQLSPIVGLSEEPSRSTPIVTFCIITTLDPIFAPRPIIIPTGCGIFILIGTKKLMWQAVIYLQSALRVAFTSDQINDLIFPMIIAFKVRNIYDYLFSLV